MIFGPVSNGAVISGNLIANVRAIGSAAGAGIYFAHGSSNHSVTGNVVKNCDGSAIASGGSNNDIVILGNTIADVNLVVAGAAIELSDATRMLISGNNIGVGGQGRAIAMRGSSDDWQIVGNILTGGGAVTLAGARSVVTNNQGYNPVGIIPNAWPVNSTDLTNQVAAGNAVPQAATAYKVRHAPKTIVVAGGSVSQIQVNGMEVGLTAGSFKLGVGETIAIAYGASAPTALVFAE
jgi:hypothetical protein